MIGNISLLSVVGSNAVMLSAQKTFFSGMRTVHDCHLATIWDWLDRTLISIEIATVVITLLVELREARKQAGLSQAELSRLSGVSQPHISAIEAGKKDATVSIARRLADTLGVSIHTLCRNPQP